jgi:hypothetical protein
VTGPPPTRFHAPGLRFALRVGLVLASLVALELLGAVLVRLDPAATVHRYESAGPRDAGAPAAAAGERYYMANESLHPFLGFVQDPGVGTKTTRRGRVARRKVTALGFIDHVVQAGKGRELVEVVILGGSVANQLVANGGDRLAARIASLPLAQGKRVRVRNLATGGYKQPQQLYALSWYLLHGNRVDVAINVDGFNDLVLGYTDNLQDGVSPFYPRGWRWRVGDLDDPQVSAAIAGLASARERRTALAARFRSSPLRRSRMVTYLWIRADRRLEGRETAAESALRGTRSRQRGGFAMTGPRFDGNLDGYLRSTVDVWARASLQLAALCRGQGIAYLHFLQPNQHDSGGKVLDRREAAIARRANPTIVSLVRQGYPLLSSAGAGLRSQGVEFFDLRSMFASVSEPLYVDACCHLNVRGNELLADRIADALARSLAAPRASVAPGQTPGRTATD